MKVFNDNFEESIGIQNNKNSILIEQNIDHKIDEKKKLSTDENILLNKKRNREEEKAK